MYIFLAFEANNIQINSLLIWVSSVSILFLSISVKRIVTNLKLAKNKNKLDIIHVWLILIFTAWYCLGVSPTLIWFSQYISVSLVFQTMSQSYNLCEMIILVIWLELVLGFCFIFKKRRWPKKIQLSWRRRWLEEEEEANQGRVVSFSGAYEPFLDE